MLNGFAEVRLPLKPLRLDYRNKMSWYVSPFLVFDLHAINFQKVSLLRDLY